MLVLDGGNDRFEFELDGTAYSVTAIDAIPYDDAKSIAQSVSTDAEAAAWIAEHIFEKEAPEAMRKMTAGQWKKLLTAYLTDGASPGESQASSS